MLAWLPTGGAVNVAELGKAEAFHAATGDVSARGLAKLAARGKPLSGKLKLIADTAEAFPMAMQNVSRFGGRSGRLRHGAPCQSGGRQRRRPGRSCHRRARHIPPRRLDAS